jgi:hypothetical protein
MRTSIVGRPPRTWLVGAADSPERALAAVRSAFPGAESVELISNRLGVRPMPVGTLQLHRLTQEMLMEQMTNLEHAQARADADRS